MNYTLGHDRGQSCTSLLLSSTEYIGHLNSYATVLWQRI